MRVITGLARGCRLETLEGVSTRPTGARSKDGIFSALQFEISGKRVLDLFAGSGQMGIEALSRGAESCVFVDKSSAAQAIIKKNLSAAARFDDVFKNNTRVIGTDALAFIGGGNYEKFDLVFLDPPFKSDLLKTVLENIEPILDRGAVVVCEQDVAASGFSENVGSLKLRKEYKYGRVKIGVYDY